jgi:starch-binding outer membrane protein, SusD/RagB family
LIAAEALAESQGVNAEAMGYINQVRSRARNWAGTISNFPEDVPAGLTKDQFIDLVLEERRLELAFEFKRWYDIKRRNLGEQVFKGPDAREPQPTFNPSRDYLMPLPEIGLNVNQNLLQNPGY